MQTCLPVTNQARPRGALLPLSAARRPTRKCAMPPPSPAPAPPSGPASPPSLCARLRAPLAGLALVAGAALRASDPALTMAFDGRTTAFSAAELSAMAHREVTAFDSHEKQSHSYSGVPVRDLLARAGVGFGDRLR